MSALAPALQPHHAPACWAEPSIARSPQTSPSPPPRHRQAQALRVDGDPMPARLLAWPQAVREPMARCILLALLLHALLAFWMGSVPPGTAEPGRGAGGMRDVPLDIRLAPATGQGASPVPLQATPMPGPDPEAAPRWGGHVRSADAPGSQELPGAATMGLATPQSARAADAALAAPPAPTVAPVEPVAAANTPTAPAAVAVPAPSPAPAPAPVDAPAAATVPLQSLSAVPAPAFQPRAEALSRETMASEGSPSTLSAVPALAAGPAAPLPTLRSAFVRQPDPSAAPPLPGVAPLPAPAQPSSLPTLPALAAAPAVPIAVPPAPSVPQAVPISAPTTVPTTAAAPPATAATTVPSAPAQPSAAAAPARAADPGAAAATSTPPPVPRPPGPDAGHRRGHDVATPGAPTPVLPQLDLTLRRPPGAALSRWDTRGALPVLPRPPETDEALARGIERSARSDCRKAHATNGLAAAAPLAADTARDAGCRW